MLQIKVCNVIRLATDWFVAFNSLMKRFVETCLIFMCVWFSPRHRTCALTGCLERRRFRRARDSEWSTPGTEGTISNPSSTEPSWSSQRWHGLHHLKPPADSSTHPASASGVQSAGVPHLEGFHLSWSHLSRGRAFQCLSQRTQLRCPFNLSSVKLPQTHHHSVHQVALNHIRLIQNICNLHFIKISNFIKTH